jgi:subtilisin family serine protease
MFSHRKPDCKANPTEENHGVDQRDKVLKFKPRRSEEVWVRGLIQVEFERFASSGLENWNFGREKHRKEPHEAWPPGLRKILQKYKLVSWKPAFPLRYPWSTESDERARGSYVEAGRDKFITLDFARGADVVRIAKELREVPELKRAAPIPELSAPAAPLTEPLTGREEPHIDAGPPVDPRTQWYLFRCGVPEAWNLGASGHGVTIADIDWGFHRNHQDLIDRIELARSMFGNPAIVSHGDMRSHGTGVLGLAGAGINDRGMAGIAYNSALWAIQAGSNYVIDESHWVAAINFVRSTATQGRRVIILEVQTRGASSIEAVPSIREEIVAAINDGIVVCVPAGNGNATGVAGSDDEGALIEETGSVLVGATKFHPHKNQRAESNGGERIVVYAPGDADSDLTCGSPPNRYRLRFGGTSGATAKVAGVVALMLEKNDQLTPVEVRNILQQSQKQVVDRLDRRVGVLVDAHQSVRDAIAMRTPSDSLWSRMSFMIQGLFG